MGCRCVWKPSLCEPTAVLVSMADRTALLRASLFPYSQMKRPSYSLRYCTEKTTMDGGGKLSQPRKSYLLCTTQAVNVLPPPFEINPIIDFISFFNGWLLLTVGPVMITRLSIRWHLFSIALLLSDSFVMREVPSLRKLTQFYTPSTQYNFSPQVLIFWSVWPWNTMSMCILWSKIWYKKYCGYVQFYWYNVS